MHSIEFKETEAYKNIKTFLYKVDISIKEEEQFTNAEEIQMLSDISRIVETSDLDSSPQRFANKGALKVFELIKSKFNDVYLINSFGNELRLDFGTGHELNYLCYIYTKFRSSKIKINEVFNTLKLYFKVVMSFIRKFNLEPAGSHGIWGLDDYQFLPFLFGSSELCYKVKDDMSKCFSASFHELGESSLFMETLNSRKPIKSVVLSKLMTKKWTDVNRELLVMYDTQVLLKKVVNQHFIYSEFLPSKKVND